MATLTDTSLTGVERRALDDFVARLRAELGDELVAVWLYGSRARGEPGGEDSDVDVWVVTRTREVDAGLDWDTPLHAIVRPLDDWYGMRRADAFIVRSLERDAIVLHGPHPAEVGANIEPVRPSPGEMHPRSKGHLDEAEAHLRVARLGIGTGPGAVVAVSYFAVEEAIRAALSERDVSPRTHPGLWHEFHRLYTRAGAFDPALHRAGQALQAQREDVHYGEEPGRATDAMARDALDIAERFVAAVRAMLGG